MDSEPFFLTSPAYYSDSAHSDSGKLPPLNHSAASTTNITATEDSDVAQASSNGYGRIGRGRKAVNLSAPAENSTSAEDSAPTGDSAPADASSPAEIIEHSINNASAANSLPTPPRAEKPEIAANSLPTPPPETRKIKFAAVPPEVVFTDVYEVNDDDPIDGVFYYTSAATLKQLPTCFSNVPASINGVETPSKGTITAKIIVRRDTVFTSLVEYYWHFFLSLHGIQGADGKKWIPVGQICLHHIIHPDSKGGQPYPKHDLKTFIADVLKPNKEELQEKIKAAEEETELHYTDDVVKMIREFYDARTGKLRKKPARKGGEAVHWPEPTDTILFIAGIYAQPGWNKTGLLRQQLDMIYQGIAHHTCRPHEGTPYDYDEPYRILGPCCVVLYPGWINEPELNTMWKHILERDDLDEGEKHGEIIETLKSMYGHLGYGWSKDNTKDRDNYKQYMSKRVESSPDPQGKPVEIPWSTPQPKNTKQRSTNSKDNASTSRSAPRPNPAAKTKAKPKYQQADSDDDAIKTSTSSSASRPIRGARGKPKPNYRESESDDDFLGEATNSSTKTSAGSSRKRKREDEDDPATGGRRVQKRRERASECLRRGRSAGSPEPVETAEDYSPSQIDKPWRWGK